VSPVWQRQDPALQYWPTAQATPQPPQLTGSVAVSRQEPLHSVSPGKQTQAPAEQVVPDWQAVPQLPQFALLAVRSAQMSPH
jgi:hypothetical protein